MRKIFFVDRNEKEDIPNQWRIGRKQSQKTKNIGTMMRTIFHFNLLLELFFYDVYGKYLIQRDGLLFDGMTAILTEAMSKAASFTKIFKKWKIFKSYFTQRLMSNICYYCYAVCDILREKSVGRCISMSYLTERDGQIAFFNNYGIDYNDDNSVLVDYTDGVYNGNIFEFKLNINDLNTVLFQAIKYLSRRRIKGEAIPATILLISLNDKKVYEYKSRDYRDDIHKVYIGRASKNNNGFIAKTKPVIYDYSNMIMSRKVKKLLKEEKTIEEKYMPINIDEDCIVGWGERYYQELPKASKGDFIGDDTGEAVSIRGEIREPKHFKGLINAYTGKSNEKFKYLMDCLNDRLSKKDLGAFYTPLLYAKKAADLVLMAVERVPEGKDYIILDRCAGTGNLESALIGLKDRNGEELISHCVVSTYEYYEYKVLNEMIGDKVREIIPPTEGDVIYQSGKISNANAMSEENNPQTVKKRINKRFLLCGCPRWQQNGNII